MSKFELGQTDVTVYFRAYDADGIGVTGILYNTTDLLIGYVRERGLPVEAEVGGSPAPASIAADDAHSDWGFVNVIDNLYRVDVPDGYMAASGSPKFGSVYVSLPDHTFVREHVDDAHVGDPRDVGDAVLSTDPSGWAASVDTLGYTLVSMYAALLRDINSAGPTGNSTTAIHMDGVIIADDQYNEHGVLVLDASDGYASAFAWITDCVASSELATLTPALPFTPADGDPYYVLTMRRDATLQTEAIAAMITAEVNALDGLENNTLTLVINGVTFNLTRLARVPIATMTKV